MKKLILSVVMLVIMIIGQQIYVDQQNKEFLRQEKIEAIKEASAIKEKSKEEEIQNGSFVIADKIYNESVYKEFKEKMSQGEDANIRVVNIKEDGKQEVYEITSKSSNEVEVKYNKNSKIYKTIGVLQDKNIEYLVVTNQETLSLSNIDNYLIIAKIEK